MQSLIHSQEEKQENIQFQKSFRPTKNDNRTPEGGDYNRLHRPTILAIEGNIGAGKTTLFNQLKSKLNNPNIVFMREPVDVWQNICDASGDSILSKFYQDVEKYAFPFQIMAFSTRLALLRKTIEEHPDCELIICERSLEADKNIFAKMLFMEGQIEDVNYQIYHHLYNSSATEYKVDAIIYVDAAPDICYKRIHIRNREGEEGISLDYLKKCRNYYHDWLIYGTLSGGKTKCIHYDGEDISGCGISVGNHIFQNERKEIDDIVYKTILTEREHIPEVLRINTNRDVSYNEGDVGTIWIQKCIEFIQEIIKK